MKIINLSCTEKVSHLLLHIAAKKKRKKGFAYIFVDIFIIYFIDIVCFVCTLRHSVSLLVCLRDITQRAEAAAITCSASLTASWSETRSLLRKDERSSAAVFLPRCSVTIIRLCLTLSADAERQLQCLSVTSSQPSSFTAATQRW